MLPKAIAALEFMKTSVFTGRHRVFIDQRTGRAFKNAEGLRKYIWAKALKTGGVKYRCPYQTRHTFASMLLSEGKIPIWVANQLGHVNLLMLQKTYGRWINPTLNSK